MIFNFLQQTNLMITQIFKVLFFIGLFISEIVFFNIDTQYAARVFGGALIGGIVLNYFDKSKPNHIPTTWIDSFIKTILSSLSSLFITPVFIKYFAITDLDYIGFTYFVCSIIALVLLKAIYSLTENNAKDIIINIFTRFANVQTKQQDFNGKINTQRKQIKPKIKEEIQEGIKEEKKDVS